MTFHSFSFVAASTSWSTSGTQPPNTYILSPISVAECRDLGRGPLPEHLGLYHLIEVMSRTHRSPNRHPLIPPYITRLERPCLFVYATAVWDSLGGGGSPYVTGTSHEQFEPDFKSNTYRSFRYNFPLRGDSSSLSSLANPPKRYALCPIRVKL